MRWDKRYGYFPRVEIPKAKAADLRRKIKVLTKVNTNLVSLAQKLEELNFILRGWAGYYRHCARAGKVFTAVDWFVTGRIWCWLRKKYRKARARDMMRFFGPSTRRPTRRLWRERTTRAVCSRLDFDNPISPWLDETASFCNIFWRAGCVPKGACPVRREAMRNHPP